MQLDLGISLDARGPVVLQIADALLLALGADALVEVDGFADALLEREAARAEGFELADIGAVRSRPLQVSGQIFSILSCLIHIMPVPMGAERNLCRLVPK